MSLRNITVSVFLAAGALLSLPISARAVTFSLSPAGSSVPNEGSFSTVPGASTITDFNSGSVPSNYSGGIVLNSGQTSGGYGPSDDTSNFLNAGAYVLSSGGGTQTASSVDIDFSATPGDYFGVYAGLVDTSNTVQFFTNNSPTPTFTFSGSDFASNGRNSYLNFTAEAGEVITRVILEDISGTTGFETDNHAFRSAAAVPFELSPALGSLALVAWGVGIGLQRKLKTNPELLSRILVK